MVFQHVASSRGLSWVVILVVLIQGAWYALPAIAAEPKRIYVTSQTMTALGKDRKVLFEGSVVLKRGDMTIRSDQMIVFLKKEQKGHAPESAQNSFDKQVDFVEAKGNVRIQKSEVKAKCGRAIFYKDQEKAVLTESPVAWQNGMRVTGTRMTIYLKEERSVVEGGSHVLIPEEGGGR